MGAFFSGIAVSCGEPALHDAASVPNLALNLIGFALGTLGVRVVHLLLMIEPVVAGLALVRVDHSPPKLKMVLSEVTLPLDRMTNFVPLGIGAPRGPKE